jgi:DNA-binding CsgD family transcriptional regulator
VVGGTDFSHVSAGCTAGFRARLGAARGVGEESDFGILDPVAVRSDAGETSRRGHAGVLAVQLRWPSEDHEANAWSIPRSSYLWPTGRSVAACLAKVERLRHADLRRLLDFVAEAVTARFSDRGQLAQLTVDRLATLVPCDLAIVTAWDARSRQLTTTATDEGLAALRNTQWEAWVACLSQHPTVAQYERTGGGSGLRFSDVMSQRAYHRLPLYQHFFRPFGIEYKLDARIRPTPGHVDFGCSRRQRDFSEHERATLDALRPYLTAMLRAADAGGAARDLCRTYGLTAREGEVLALLARGRSNRELASTLFLSPGTVRKHLEHIYAKLGVSTRTQAVAHALTTGLAPAADTPARDMLHHIDATELAALYALTDREIEVLARASLGASNAAIAATLHVSPETIKKHLDHVYTKLGVRRRTEATGRALSLGII